MLSHRELARVNVFEELDAKDTVEKEMICECFHGHVF